MENKKYFGQTSPNRKSPKVDKFINKSKKWKEDYGDFYDKIGFSAYQFKIDIIHQVLYR